MPPQAQPRTQVIHQVNSCLYAKADEYRKCQADLDAEQNRRIADLQKQVTENKAATAALAFLIAKAAVVNKNASLVRDALDAAKTNFDQILSLKDFHWTDITFDLVWALGNMFVPALGTALLPLKAWRNNTIGGDQTRLKLFFGKSVERLGNLVVSDANVIRNHLEKIESNNEKVSNQNVIESVKAEIRKQFDIAAFFATNFYELLKKHQGQLPPGYNIEAEWNNAGLGEYGTAMDLKIENLSRIMLYKLIQEYTKQKCSFILHKTTVRMPGSRPQGPPSTFPSNGNQIGKFNGLSEKSREAIYNLFGNTNPANFAFVWLGSPEFPRINSYKDMIEKWKMPVIR